MKALKRAFVLCLMLFLAGCAGLPTMTPAPEPSHNSAVLSLLEQAKTQAASGKSASAGATLERALRIEPRNPYLWQELARVRLDQKKYRQAENLAAKSNALARGDRSLRAANWRIIARARGGRGDLKGAQAAYEKAEE
ncbi:MAG: tetratricopeptide repeat protein [Deltaproteobacteria bacterium]|nr:tetratricopeptide repeat protein [Deltaproteobacteria bacterium]